MSKGYTPVFNTIYDGSLHGKWPAAAVFASILPLLDVDGTIDMHPHAIAARTGWPLELLQQGLDQLMAPDASSRSTTSQGRRLELLEEHRNWGWRVVNAEKYREKARLMGKNAREVESGRNRARMEARNATPPAPPCQSPERHTPPVTAGDRLSHTDSDSSYSVGKSSDSERSAHRITSCGTAANGPAPHSQGSEMPVREPPREEVWRRVKAAYPPGLWQGTPHEINAERAVERLLDDGVPGSTLIDSCMRYRLQAQEAGRIGTRYIRGIDKHFTENHWRGNFPLPVDPKRNHVDTANQAARDWVAEQETLDAVR